MLSTNYAIAGGGQPLPQPREPRRRGAIPVGLQHLVGYTIGSICVACITLLVYGFRRPETNINDPNTTTPRTKGRGSTPGPARSTCTPSSLPRPRPSPTASPSWRSCSGECARVGLLCRMFLPPPFPYVGGWVQDRPPPHTHKTHTCAMQYNTTSPHHRHTNRWKSFYFLKGFRATGTLVQMVTQTIVEVRWFLLMLIIIGADVHTSTMPCCKCISLQTTPAHTHIHTPTHGHQTHNKQASASAPASSSSSASTPRAGPPRSATPTAAASTPRTAGARRRRCEK